MKTSDLMGPKLDWAVATALHLNITGVTSVVYVNRKVFMPSIYWEQAGPIIESEHIEWQWLPSPSKDHQYGARKPSLGGLNRTYCVDGPTVLIAAMRCFVASRLGDTVDIPEELK